MDETSKIAKSTDQDDEIIQIWQLATQLPMETQENGSEIAVTIDFPEPQFTTLPSLEEILREGNNDRTNHVADFQLLEDSLEQREQEENDPKIIEANKILQQSWKKKNTKIAIKRKEITPKRRIRELWNQLGECFRSRARAGEKLYLLLAIGKEIEKMEDDSLSQLQLVKGKNERPLSSSVRKRLQLAKWLAETFPNYPEKLLSVKSTFYQELCKLEETQLQQLRLLVQNWL